ncbi:phage distal tail protein [Nakamurella panacisegetis]|nr:phage tail domain-containing protein [Nakamurella panacisegetis]
MDGPAPDVDDAGCLWALETVEGWHGGIDPRGNPTPLEMADGDLDGPAPFGSRTITLSGTVVAPDKRALQMALDRVAAVLRGTVRTAPLVFEEALTGLARQAFVRLAGKTMTTRTGPTSASWSLSLYAHDPSRYGAVEKSATTARFSAGGGRVYPLTFPRVYGPGGSSGLVTVTNVGDARTWARFTFSGPLSNPSVRLVGGPRIAALMDVNAGEQLVIGEGTPRSVRLGMSSRRQFLTLDSQFFAIEPGTSQIYFGADSGTGTLTVAWRDAWT